MEECIYCKRGAQKPILGRQGGEGLIYDDNDLEIEIEDDYGGYIFTFIEINYCPICGRYLKEDQFVKLLNKFNTSQELITNNRIIDFDEIWESYNQTTILKLDNQVVMSVPRGVREIKPNIWKEGV